VLPLVQDLRVDLVGEDGDAVPHRGVGDRAEARLGDDSARRVVWVVEDDELRLRGHLGDQLVDVERVSLLLEEPHRHRHPADEADHRLVDRKAGVRVENLVAGVDEREDQVEHDGLPARGHHHHLRRGLHAAPRGRVLGDRLPQLGEPRRGAVVGGPAPERLDGRIADVRGGVEVRLADLEVDDAAALRLEGPRADQDFERGLRPEPRQAFRELHRSPPRVLYRVPAEAGLVRRDQGKEESSRPTP
jgi:hypothetical protein